MSTFNVSSLETFKCCWLNGFTRCTGTTFSASLKKFSNWTNAFLASNHQFTSQDCKDLWLKFLNIRLLNYKTFSCTMDCLAFTEFASGTRPPFTTPRIVHLHSSSGTDIINQDPPQLVGDSRICAQYFCVLWRKILNI